MKKSLLLAFLATAVVGVRAQAQTFALINPTTNNGSFEQGVTAAVDFTPTTSSTGTVPYWGSTSGTNDTGVGVGGGTNEAGNNGAYEQPGTGIFNLVTNRPIVAGDVYTLTFYGRDTNGFDSGTAYTTALVASFYYQPVPTGATYSYAPTATLGTPMTFTLNSNPSGAMTFTQYTLTATATAASVGGDIGIVLTNNGPNYNGLDNFVLTVTAAVPEPSTYAMLAVGVFGGMMFRRRRV